MNFFKFMKVLIIYYFHIYISYIVNKQIEKSTSYEIRICSIYNDLMSNWSNIYKIKTNSFEGIILNEIQKEGYLKKISEWTGFKKMALIYRGTKDGSDTNSFHNKCNNQGPTICLCKNEKGSIFGGYSSISWTSDNNYHASNDNFLFTIKNIHGTAPTKYPITKNNNNAVYHASKYGPTFGANHDLYISNNYLNNESSYCRLGSCYTDILGKGNSIFSGDINNNYFKLKELEVYKLYN